MSYAYDEVYLTGAQRILGDMYDYAVNTLSISLREYQKMFLASGIARQFGKGNPMYIAGKNGCEIAREVVSVCTGVCPEQEDAMYTERSPQFWLGWSLAYYQWQQGVDFKQIESACPAEELLGTYGVMHEADIHVFVEVLDEKMRVYQRVSQLKRLRTYAGLTQSALANRAQVPLRQIQLFEQGQRDINKCQVHALIRLAKALGCDVTDIISDNSV